MKKFIAVTTSLCAVMCATALLTGATASAEADEGLNFYPETFTKTGVFSDLKDYAVGEDKFCVLDGSTVYVFDGEYRTAITSNERYITSVHFTDKFVYGTSDGKFFDFDNVEEENFSDETKTDNIYIDNFYYYFGNGALKVLDKNADDPAATLEGFDKLKLYGNSVYAVKENVLYKLSGANNSEIVLKYFDYTDAANILTGDFFQSVKSFSATAPSFVTVNGGVYITEIDLDNSTNGFFKALETKKADTGNALLLGTAGTDGSVSVVMMNNKCFMLKSSNTTALPRPYAVQEASFTTTVTITDSYLYCAPFVKGSTRIKAITAGEKLAVKGIVTKQLNPEIMRDFYIVEFEDEGGQKTVGYVPKDYVSEATFNETDYKEHSDKGATTEDLVKPVVLVLLVVLLCLIAGCYMVHVGSVGRKKNKKNKIDSDNQ